ncbi:hypothetical protein INT48_008129 [Thamnidium elegans]|uniref:CCR4-NOT transcription complex subunit 4 n=1 Tax=Thamnidium elegans TaxID=101142 RepID=A0A8H7SXG0_9FUNG|nr:hypothetical protein INT48_008129 [Thamnidium elegans]
MSSDEEDSDCPLCMEELDIADRNFRPCPCGYQICRFCWHHIKTNLNGRCPACRRLYSDQIVEFVPVSAEEIVRLKKEKKEKDRQTRDMRDPSRRQLSNVRVVQKNLVYVLGLSLKHANVDNELFKKYGRIDKVVISKRSAPSSGSNSSVGIYVTFARKEDANRAIEAMNGMEYEGKTLRASYGTTKYCTYYLRHMSCPNPNCMYLHEPGDDVDSYSKDTVSIGKHANTSVSSSSTTTYPNKRPAIAVKATPAASSSTTTATTPEPKPATAPRTWAPIPKVVPIPPVVIPKPESPVLEPVVASPPFKEVTTTTTATAAAKASSSSSSKKIPAVKPTKSTVSKKPIVEKQKKVLVVPEEDERPALPATASWAKAPVVNHESVITPANFGPSLSDALHAPQKPKHSPSLKEFEEAEREAKIAATRPKVAPKPAESSRPTQVEPRAASVVDQTTTVTGTADIKKEEIKTETLEQEVEARPEMVEIKKAVEEPATEQTTVEQSVTKEPAVTEEESVQQDEIMQQDNHQQDSITDDIMTDQDDDEEEEEFEPVQTERDTEKIENLASLNENIIKAFDNAANESSEKVQADENRNKDVEDDASDTSENAQTISSPMAAMDRLSALVQQEIMTNSPEPPQFDEATL